jgi:hypothetical protein
MSSKCFALRQKASSRTRAGSGDIDLSLDALRQPERYPFAAVHQGPRPSGTSVRWNLGAGVSGPLEVGRDDQTRGMPPAIRNIPGTPNAVPWAIPNP